MRAECGTIPHGSLAFRPADANDPGTVRVLQSEPRVLSSIAALIIAAALTPPGDGAASDESSVPACCRTGDARAAAILAAAGDAVPVATGSSDLDPGLDEGVVATLDAIDAQTLALRDFASRVRMDSYDELADETERRFGRVYLRMPTADGSSGRAAAVVFERTIEPSGRARERLEHFVFADGVLSDYDHEAKRLVRRRLVEAGEDRDPLRLGQGPVPIPIAQRKADILAAFDVTAGPAIPERLLKDATDLRALHLVPKPGTSMAEDGRIASIDLWVRGADATPVAVEIHDADGDRTALRFLEPQLNAGLDETAARWLVPPPVDESLWRIEES